jgi:hypothetical protein
MTSTLLRLIASVIIIAVRVQGQIPTPASADLKSPVTGSLGFELGKKLPPDFHGETMDDSGYGYWAGDPVKYAPFSLVYVSLTTNMTIYRVSFLARSMASQDLDAIKSQMHKKYALLNKETLKLLRRL